MQIQALKSYRRRHPKGEYFADLPAEKQERARQWLKRFVERSTQPVPRWRFAIQKSARRGGLRCSL